MAQESRLVIVIDSKNAERNARNLGNELDSIERKGEFASKSMDGLSVATRTLAGYMAGLVTAGEAVSKMDAYTGLQNRLKLVTKNQTELNKATEDTFNIAQKTYSAWDSVLQVYQRFSDNAKTLNLTMDDTARLTETVSKAVAISGASAQAADAALVQFGQALASGTLRGEELNSVMEQTPALAKAIAQGMGITVGELRSVAAEGKITSQEIVKALKNVQNDVDALFAKTDITIGQSLTLLNNQVTKFVGEAGKGSGAAQTLASGIKLLGNNLNVIIDGAIVVGIGLITKSILTKTVAVQASIVASAQQRAANFAEAQSQLQLLGIEAMRARQSAALAITEIGLARAEYNAALSANARAAAIQRLTAAEIAHNIAVKEATIATTAYSVAQSRLTTVATLGSRALGLVGGPIGAITLGITALAAGYMYFQDKAAKANQKLEEQAKVAERTDEALKKLSGNDKTKAVNDLTTAFKAQNEALEKSSFAVGAALIDIENYARGNKEVEKISQDARTGTISYSEAIERLNKIKLPTDLYENLKTQAAQYDENSSKANLSAEKLKLFGVEVNLAGNKAQNAAVQVKGNTDELNSNANAADKAAKAQKGYFDSLRAEVLKSNEELALLNQGYSEEAVKKILELQKAKQAVAPPGTTAIVTKEEMDLVAQAVKTLDLLKDKKDELTAAERKHTSELEKQQKILSVNEKVRALSSKYNIPAKATAAGIPQGLIEGMIMQESRGDTYRKGKLLTSSVGAQGLAQFMPKTAKQYGVDVKSEESSINGMIRYVSDLLKTFNGSVDKAVIAYNAGPGNVKSGKANGFEETKNYRANVKAYAAGFNGYTAGDISSKDFDKLLQDNTKLAEEQAKLRLQLENEVANQVTKIRNDLAKKLEDVDKANFSPERKEQIKAELQARAENDIAIAEQATKSKLDSYRDFLKTEEQLLKESFAKRQFEAAHDLELTKEQRNAAVDLLAKQLQQELALIQIAREQRLFQARQFLYSEVDAIKERYRIEREQIELTTKDEEERRERLTLSKAQERLEVLDKAFQSSKNWDQTKADMTGNSQQYELNQTRTDRRAQSLNLANTQVAALDIQAKDPNANLEALNAQREQIMKEHFERLKLIESTYQNDSMSLQLGYGANVTGALAGMFKNMLGESSSAYRILYESQRAFALAQAGMNMWKAASDAYANEPGTWYQKAAAAAIATIKSGTFVSLIQAATPQGFADGGYTGNGLKHTPAGIVHKGEVVWSQDDIKRWGGVSVVESMRQSKPSGYANGGYVSNNTTDVIATRREARQFDAINSGRIEKSQPTVTIINQTSEKVDATSEWDGKELTVILKEYQKQNEAMVDSKIEKRFMMSKRQGW
ncbi:TPA: tape measure protein [Acinetobacter nosocomialis]|uniref:tape measure protein n=1 Tax=Acinetobacter nosocomialis TaxID=106654 RepID=UPI00237E3D6D|nr:tape measure protein [Acinetobacter nosocomialis]MDE1667680.1 tape measure protein [Acinetobacter nosocomialis]HDH7781085.1 tape measure protein [Acinetobacter nosocomialis]